MNPAFDFSAETTPEELLAEIERSYSIGNPNIGKTQSCFLKNGPLVFKIALFQQIVDRTTREHHHNVLTLRSIRKFKDGWKNQEERVVVLDDEKVDEISTLEEFISEFRSYAHLERKSYSIVGGVANSHISSHSEIDDKISEILEDADNHKKIVEQGGMTLVKDVLEWVFKQKNTQSLVEHLGSLDIDSLRRLTTVAGITQINKILEIWEQNILNNSEEFWQNILTEFSWVVSQVFASPTILYREKAYIGGKMLDNKGGNLVDIIYKNQLSSNISLIELKTPCTEILGKEYRQTYSMSNETSGAISQALNYKYQIQQHYTALRMADRESIFEVINPKTLLIIGNFNSELLGDNSKIEAFELYRQNLKDVCILTYDELFLKVSILRDILQNGK